MSAVAPTDAKGMRGTISRRVTARVLGATWVVAGFVATVDSALPTGRGTSRALGLVIGPTISICGLLIGRLPWDRWPHRSVLALVPISFAVIATGPLLGSAELQRYVAYNHAGYFVVVFVWIGLTQPRWTESALLCICPACGTAVGPIQRLESNGAGFNDLKLQRGSVLVSPCSYAYS